MTILEQFGAFLRNDEFISSKIADRLDVLRAQQGRQKPYGLLNELIVEPYHNLQGETGVSKTMAQLDFWADGPDGRVTVHQLANRVRALLDGFSGLFATDGLNVQSAIVTRFDPSLGNRPQDGSDNYVYRASLDIDLIHSDPVE